MTQLLQNAAYGTALILAAALLRRVLKDRLAPEARLALWAACLFRLLTPAAPESALSLWGLFEPQKQAVVPMPGVADYVPGVAAPITTPAPRSGPVISWETVLVALWIAGSAALAVWYALSWARTRRAAACAVPVGRDDPRYAALPRFARLREGPMEGAPLTFGALRPTVVLSPGLEGPELDCVLAHEGVHAARRDNLWHYVMALALVVHWWDPAVWLMSRLLRRDIELSCDRAAVKKLGADRRAEYAQALVSLAAQGSGPAFCHTFGQKAAEERIRSVMKFKKTTIVGIIFSLALVLALTAAFASEPKAPENDTVEFHGQAFARAELSQSTLDWLDWYLALPEGEQLAVSYVPAELRPEQAPETVDAPVQDSEPVPSQDQPAYVGNEEDGKDDSSTSEMTLDEYKALLDQLVSDKEMTQEDADELFAAAEEMVEKMEQRDGEDPIKLMVGDRGSCVVYTWHQSRSQPDVSATPQPTPAQPKTATAPVPACGVAGCTETRHHQHIDGHCVLLGDPCPVAGCTTPGCHDHGDGTVYACNGYHSGGVCDGSCLVNNQSAQTGSPAPNACPPEAIDKNVSIPTRTNCYSGSHHSESHHSSHHR